MLHINHLNFRYTAARPAVFKDFSLDIEAGKIVGLLGKNGTGKSTLLYLISGLLRPQRGEVLFTPRLDMNARETTETTTETTVPWASAHATAYATRLRRPETLSEIFIVPEEFDLPAITMERYVAVNQPFYPRFDRQLFEQNLAAFELTPDLNLGQLSMGQKKKAFMAFALAASTHVLLMDEPTNGLDIPSKSQFRRVVANSMTDQRTIIISTHQVHDVEMLVDHVVMLEGDRLLINASTASISSRLTFEQRPYGADLSDALYVEPSIAGNAVIAPARGTDDTPLNLELLFNALIQNPNLLQQSNKNHEKL